jgi:hypothetical protein
MATWLICLLLTSLVLPTTNAEHDHSQHLNKERIYDEARKVSEMTFEQYQKAQKLNRNLILKFDISVD